MPAALAPWFEALAASSRWRAVVAVLDDDIVGGGFVHLQGANAWLGAGGVRPEARRLHAHRALMTLRLQQAVDAGCSQIATETGEAITDEISPSLRNMQACGCGFTKAFSRLNLPLPSDCHRAPDTTTDITGGNMFLGIYRFQGDAAQLLAGYDRLIETIPHQGLQLHVCAHDDKNLWIYDTCPTREAFVAFASGDMLRTALQAAGLPTPEVKLVGDVHAAFVAGSRSV